MSLRFVLSGTTATRIAWAMLAALIGWRFLDIATFDVRTHPVSGDQTNFVMQAQSLLHGANLSYDADDLARWVEFGWADKPYGLFFRSVENDWVFAKPYGYSLYLVPFMWMLGDAAGIAVANASLLALMVVAVVALLRLRLTGATVPLLAGAFVFMSANQFYGWVVHTELFLATLVGLACWLLITHLETRTTASAVAGTVVAAFLFSEKATMALVIGPLILVVLRTSPRRRQAMILGAGIAATLVFVAPYLWYSGGEHWNPYQGERYYSRGDVPFAGPVPEAQQTWTPALREKFFSPNVLNKVTQTPELIPQSALTTVVGRHTGLLAFAPLAFLVLLRAIRRFRTMPMAARGVLLGIGAYLILYAVLLPNGYTGGASLGNRYFVQISLATVALLVLDPPRPRTSLRLAVAAATMSLLLTLPHHVSPRNAYSERLHVTTPSQRLLPPETQLYYWFLFDK